MRAATKWFFVSRLLLAAVVAAAAAWLPAGPCYVHKPNPVFDALIVWDSGWYLGIARDGYHFDPSTPGQYSVAFLPLHPIVVRAVAGVLGGGVEALQWCGLAVTNLLFWVALVLLHRLAEDDLSPAVADRATFLLAFFPATIACASAYSEPLFLVTVLAAFLCMRRGRFVEAGLWSALASVTRPFGMLMPLVALAGAVQAHRRGEPVKPWLRAAAIAPLGLLAWYGWLHVRFGDALAFYHAQQMGWRPHVVTIGDFLAAGRVQVLGALHGELEHLASPYPLLLLPLAALVRLVRTDSPLRGPFVAYQAGCLALSIATATPTFDGGTRYLMVGVPMYLALAAWSAEHPWGGRALACWLVGGAVTCAALFTRSYWVF